MIGSLNFTPLHINLLKRDHNLAACTTMTRFRFWSSVAARRVSYDDIVKNNQASPIFEITKGGVSLFEGSIRELPPVNYYKIETGKPPRRYKGRAFQKLV